MVIDYVHNIELYDAVHALALFRVGQVPYVAYIINLRVGQKFDEANLYLWFHRENPSPYDGIIDKEQSRLDPPYDISLLLPIFIDESDGTTVPSLEASLVKAPNKYGAGDSVHLTDNNGWGLYIAEGSATLNTKEAGIVVGRDGIFIKGKVMFEKPSNTFGWFKKNTMAVIPSTVVTPFPDLWIDIDTLSKLLPGL